MMLGYSHALDKAKEPHPDAALALSDAAVSCPFCGGQACAWFAPLSRALQTDTNLFK